MVIVNGQEQKLATCMLSDIIKAFAITEAEVTVDGIPIPITSQFRVEETHKVVITTAEFKAFTEDGEVTKPDVSNALAKMIKKGDVEPDVNVDNSTKQQIAINLPESILEAMKRVEPNESGVVSIAIYDDGSAAILNPKGGGPKMVRVISLNVETGDSNIVNTQGSSS